MMLISAIILIILSPWMFVLAYRLNIKDAFCKLMEYIFIGEMNKDNKEKTKGYF